jgi:hypothetical protein
MTKIYYLELLHASFAVVSTHSICKTDGKLIAVCSQSISFVSGINPSVSFYDIRGRKREVLFFYFVPDTTRDNYYKKQELDTRLQEIAGNKCGIRLQ